jgi:hypothetical protein
MNVRVMRLLNEFLEDPVAPVVPSPHSTKNKPAGNRSPRNDDGPEVPNQTGLAAPFNISKLLSLFAVISGAQLHPSETGGQSA